MTPLRILVTTSVLLGVAGPQANGVAQARANDTQTEEPLVTDRPDITESSTVVGAGRFQVETSVQVQRFEAGPFEATTWSTPTLLRVGVTGRLELRLETDAFSSVNAEVMGGDRSSGYAPIALGAKYHLSAAGDGARPSLGVLAHVEVPSGSGAFKMEDTAGTVVLAADWELTGTVSLGLNGGVDIFEEPGGDTRTGGLFSAAVGYGLAGKTGSFLEIAVADIGLGDRSVILDGGITHRFRPGAQIDVAVGGGLTRQTEPDVFVTLGFSLRASYLGRG
ncbi:MAG: transporter [Candidatus Krumholzibacteriia bacterium]